MSEIIDLQEERKTVKITTEVTFTRIVNTLNKEHKPKSYIEFPIESKIEYNNKEYKVINLRKIPWTEDELKETLNPKTMLKNKTDINHNDEGGQKEYKTKL